jgi:hypothetical protein
MYQGVRFVNMTITLESFRADVQFDWARFLVHTKYADYYEAENTVALIDASNGVLGQIIFTENQPQTRVITQDNPSSLELLYNLEGKSASQIQIAVGLYQTQVISNSPGQSDEDFAQSLIVNNTKSYLEPVADFPLEVFDYQKVLLESNISYVLCRDSDTVQRFVNDPLFTLVFANDKLSIFKVNGIN